MAFRPANISEHMTKFNSAASCDFLDLYDRIVDEEIVAANNEVKHRTFAPSSFKCDRINWFRLRGVQPDRIENPDKGLQFTADIGSACHEIIQSRLASCNIEGFEYLDVEEYLKTSGFPYKYTVTRKGHECLIEIDDPPVRFAVDGLIKFKGTVYLLEIKTSEFGSFNDIVNIKERHLAQVKCYLALLNISNGLVLYMDRQYGGTKCFEIKVSESERHSVLDKMRHIQSLAAASIAPDKLPSGDSLCSANMCPYYKKCKEW